MKESNFPFVALLFILFNVGTFYYLVSNDLLFSIINKWGFSFSNFKSRPLVSITSIFLHINYFHLIVNMWFLYLFGTIIEKRLFSGTFFMLYLAGGIIGNLVHAFMFLGQAEVPVIGASGAISAVLGAFLIKLPKDKVSCLLLFVIPLKIHVWILLGGFLLYEVANAIYFPSPNVAHWAHIGGFTLGVFVGTYERISKRAFRYKR